MDKLRLLLLPFSWTYGLITGIRNSLFNKGILNSYQIPKKSIVIGNLSTGGTGKTPHVDFLINHFVKQGKKVSSLSRGYGRNTSENLVVENNSTSNEVGDEPLFYKKKYKKKINVVVAEKRKEGVELINKHFPNNELIILDDAFQHRAVKAGLNILLTDYNHLFTDDYVLPAGNLREWKSGVNRADIVIVSKCPKDISIEEQNKIRNRISFSNDKIFFSHIIYDELKPVGQQEIKDVKSILLVTGIANPTPLISYLKRFYIVEHIYFKDHHEYSTDDIRKIHKKFDTFATQNKAIITTEKDMMRLNSFDTIHSADYPWFYQPITTEVIEQENFNTIIDNYVNEI